MTEFTINLDDPRAFAAALRNNVQAGDESPATTAAWSVAVQIEAQIQPDVPAEPTGDVVVLANGQLWRQTYGDARGPWTNNRGAYSQWLHLSKAHDLKVYRREPSPEAVEALPEPKIKKFYYPNTKVTRADLGLPEAEEDMPRAYYDPMDDGPDEEPAVPVEKVRQVLRSSLTGYLTNEETLTAYKDLRKRVAALLPEGAQ